MNEDLIYLCDLTHTSQGYAAELTPYPIACIKSWLFEYTKYPGRFQVDIFKDPQSFLNSFLEHKPAVVGFSNYMWNLDLTYTISKEIKAAYPETFIIFGGPNSCSINKANWNTSQLKPCLNRIARSSRCRSRNSSIVS